MQTPYSEVARMLQFMLQASASGAPEPTTESDALDFIVDSEGNDAPVMWSCCVELTQILHVPTFVGTIYQVGPAR